ncbi:hypothetical protein [Streptomyces sp. NPDC001530]|uniref:hypothetical protein n=1 Tax=Streptomyces sp. NPDC001530 TaxID=3364582 RepID=UPI00367AEF6C
MGAKDGNRRENAVIGEHSSQIGEVRGDVTVVTGSPGNSSRAPGLIRVPDADPFRPGVHRPLRGAGSGTAAAPLPAYVPRDTGVRDLRP